jgi:hypothetical protein
MRSIVDFAVDEIVIPREEILRSQGIPEKAEISDNFERILDEAIELFSELAEPGGIFAGIGIDGFERVLRGDGLNEMENPVDDIFRKSTHLALFAVTLGPVLSGKVTELFDNEEYALGYMLDSVSSFAADRLADLIANEFRNDLTAPESGDLRVLSYSPGYCGWHISGQKKLFEALQPEEIGITLNDSCLMTPIKSVSGVLIAGPREIHEFINSYPFCDTCSARTCIGRMHE